MLGSVLHQRPEDRELERMAQSKYDYCMNRIQSLQSMVAHETSGNVQQAKHVMAELHIDNQTKRGSASSDYTPLHNAIHRAPLSVTRDSGHRLSRTDSQMSGSSTSSAGHSSTSHRSASTICDNNTVEKTIHTVPPQLQRSIAQLQQKQQRDQTQQSQQLHKYNQMTATHHRTTHQQSNPQHVDKPPPVPQHSVRKQPPNGNSRHSSNSSMDSETRAANSTSSNNLYREVNIPTTLQRMDYIRDGYKTRSDRQGCPSPSVIPPPKEFQQAPDSPRLKHSSTTNDTQKGSHTLKSSSNGNHVSQQNSRIPGAQFNGYTGNNHSSQPTNNQPAPYSRSISQPTQDYRDLPPKQNINKQSIRDLLVQDMLKRQGQQGSTGQAVDGKRSAGYQSSSAATSNNKSSYSAAIEEPLWTPPQPSAYERGLSHYDRPNYQRQNLYGQVNSQPSTSNRYPPSGGVPQQSLVSFLLFLN